MVDISKYTIDKLAGMALQKPDDFGYWGSEDTFVTWGFCGIDQNRASSVLERSNFEVITKDLINRFPDDFRIEGYKHWLVGHVDRLVCRVLKTPNSFIDENITDAFRAAMFWHEKLMDYPIADEDHYSDMEFEEMIDTFKQMPKYLLDLINTSNDDWAEKIYHELISNMNVELSADAELYPNDDEILEAVYNLQMWNKDNIEGWSEFIDINNLEPIPYKKVNPNQLNLFED